jgi:hypothetical protein
VEPTEKESTAEQECQILLRIFPMKAKNEECKQEESEEET